MPATVRRQGGKFRVVHRQNGKMVPVKNRSGTAVDGGGHSSAASARRQARAVNANS